MPFLSVFANFANHGQVVFAVRDSDDSSLGGNFLPFGFLLSVMRDQRNVFCFLDLHCYIVVIQHI